MYIYEIRLSNLEFKIAEAQIQISLESPTRSEPKDQQHAASLSSRPPPPRPRLGLFDQDEGGHPGRHGRRHDWQCWPCPSDALWVTLFKMMVVLWWWWWHWWLWRQLVSPEIPGGESLSDVIVNCGSTDNFDKRFPVNAPQTWFINIYIVLICSWSLMIDFNAMNVKLFRVMFSVSDCHWIEWSVLLSC